MIRVSLAQINPVVGDLAGNSQKIAAAVEATKRQAADIVVFPEMALCGYPPEDLLFKESFVSDNLRALRMLAKKIRGVTAIIGFVDRDAGKKSYNAAAVISNGRVRGVYHKEKLPNYGVFDEKRYFQEGRKNPLFKINGVTFGVSICEDLWDEKGPHVWQVKAGARLLINIASSPYDVGKLRLREKLLSALARKYRVPVCYVNLVGGQDDLVFDGGSVIFDPLGKMVATGKQFAEDLVCVDLEISAGRQGRFSSPRLIPLPSPMMKKPPLAVAKAKRLTQIERVYHALVLGTQDYVRKNGFQKVVVGLSGGIDSALVAVLAAAAVGKENVVGISMPSVFSSAETRADARRLAERLEIQFLEVPIQNIFESYLRLLSPHFTGTTSGTAEENLQARIRGNLLMAFSNKFGWLVLTTGNKSEVAVGYCTLYGDMSGGFGVIKDVPKTLVYQLARFVNRRQGQVIPETILTRPPTAELKKNQRDQDTLPPYDVLDGLIKDYVEEHKSFAQISRRIKDRELVKNFVRMVDRSEYKRRQAPPGVKITPRAFGKDWRLPITNKYKGF